MKTLSEKVTWYKESETRLWRQIVSNVLMSFFSVCGVAILVVMLIYGDGTNLQPVLFLFTLVVSLSVIAMTFAIIKSSELKRWHIEIIEFGYAGAIGISAVATFLLIEMQYVNT